MVKAGFSGASVLIKAISGIGSFIRAGMPRPRLATINTPCVIGHWKMHTAFSPPGAGSKLLVHAHRIASLLGGPTPLLTAGPGTPFIECAGTIRAGRLT